MVNRIISCHLSFFQVFSSLNLYGDWHLTLHSITTMTDNTVRLSVTHVGIINEEMGEAGLAARSASQIELTSILAG